MRRRGLRGYEAMFRTAKRCLALRGDVYDCEAMFTTARQCCTQWTKFSNITVLLNLVLLHAVLNLAVLK